MTTYPTPWQQKTMWAALTALFIVFLIVTAASVVWVVANLISFLQPILIPVAIAAILAYLLDPVVTRMCKGGLGRTKAVALLFVIVFLALLALGGWLVPMISMQSANFAKELPGYTEKARDRVVDLIYRYNRTFGAPAGARGKTASPSTSFVNWLLGSPPPHPSAAATATASPSVTLLPESAGSPTEMIAPAPSKISSADRQKIQEFDQIRI